MKVPLTSNQRLIGALVIAPAVVYLYGAAYVLIFLSLPDALANTGYRDKTISLLLFPTLPSFYLGAAVCLIVAFTIWRRFLARIASLIGINAVFGMLAGLVFHFTVVAPLSSGARNLASWCNALVLGSALAVALAGVAIAFAAIAYGPASIFRGSRKQSDRIDLTHISWSDTLVSLHAH